MVSWRNVQVGSFLTPVGITGTATANTDFEVTTEDLNFAAGTTRLEYTLKIKVAPSITDITDKTATFGTNLLVDVDAVDTNPEDTLQYQASSGDTAVATVSPTALPPLGANSQVTATPVGQGTATITVTVSDGREMAMDTFVVTVSRAQLGTPVVTLAAGDGQLTPSWAAVTGASRYGLQWKRSSVTSWAATTGVTTVASTTSGTAITGLTNGEAHDVRVRARTSAGSTTYIDSAWSSGTQGTPTASGNMVTKEKLDEVNEEVAPSIINEVAARQTAIITNRFEIISSGLNRGDLSMEKVANDVADYIIQPSSRDPSQWFGLAASPIRQ